MVEPTPATLAALRNLHGAAAPPIVPVTTAAPVTVSLEMLQTFSKPYQEGRPPHREDGLPSASRLPQTAWTQRSR